MCQSVVSERWWPNTVYYFIYTCDSLYTAEHFENVLPLPTIRVTKLRWPLMVAEPHHVLGFTILWYIFNLYQNQTINSICCSIQIKIKPFNLSCCRSCVLKLAHHKIENNSLLFGNSHQVIKMCYWIGETCFRSLAVYSRKIWRAYTISP